MSLLQNCANRVVNTICQWTHNKPPPLGAIIAAAARLGAQRLLLLDSAGFHLKMKVMLSVDKDDVANIISSDKEGLAELQRLM